MHCGIVTTPPLGINNEGQYVSLEDEELTVVFQGTCEIAKKQL
jgi:hypothetical protein